MLPHESPELLRALAEYDFVGDDDCDCAVVMTDETIDLLLKAGRDDLAGPGVPMMIHDGLRITFVNEALGHAIDSVLSNPPPPAPMPREPRAKASSRTISKTDNPTLFRLAEAIFPRRFTTEELGDAAEELTRMATSGASWVRRGWFVWRTLFWLFTNVARAAGPVALDFLRTRFLVLPW